VKILVIGGTRFMGRQLVWRLLAGGHALALFNRGRQPDPFGERVERLRGDRAGEDLVRALAGRSFDAVVDFAAYRGEDARRAAQLLEGRTGHYVFISSGQTYLVRRECPRPARESDYAGALLPAPTDAGDRGQWDYGIGKREAEDALEEAWQRSRFPATRLRLPMVNGEGDPGCRIAPYLWRILDGGPLLLPDGGELPMRHIYSGSAVRAIAALLGSSRTHGQAYNLAQDETPTVRELLTLLADALGAPARLAPLPRAALERAGLDVTAVSPFSDRWMSFIDPARARTELGFRHEPLRTYLEKITTAFLERVPAIAPAGYASRAAELALARSAT
jgi:nucleoside-diphosphate-sugar epimerase